MAKAIVKFFSDLGIPPPLEPRVSVETEPLKVMVLDTADNSDPMKRFLVVGFRVGRRCVAASTVDRKQAAGNVDLETAIAGLILAALDNAPAIRDAIAQEKA